MMKKILKHVLAALLGLAILNGFCAWYYNTAPYVHTEDRATDAVRRPFSWVSQAKEGMGWHRIDANGYNNPAGEGPISVLMMGSSHTEGFNVPAGQDVSARLDALVDGRVYNLGMSDHPFYRNAANLGRALERFRPTRAVVLETDRMVFMRDQVNDAMNDTLARNPETRFPLPDILVNQPLSKRLYKQFMGLVQGTAGDEEEVDYDDLPASLLEEYEQSLTAWFTAMNETARSYGVQLIIWYHPHLAVRVDGSAGADTPAVCRTAFVRACERSGVTLVDLTEPFLAAYESDDILPHGFANTAMGAGHLNADGHRMAAEAIAAAMREGGDAS